MGVLITESKRRKSAKLCCTPASEELDFGAMQALYCTTPEIPSFALRFTRSANASPGRGISPVKGLRQTLTELRFPPDLVSDQDI